MSWDSAACKTGNGLFSFQRYTRRVHIVGYSSPHAVGEGLWAVRPCFSFRGLSGSVSTVMEFKGPPKGRGGQNRIWPKQDQSGPKSAFNHYALTQWRQDRSAVTNWTTETLREVKNKWPCVDMKYWPNDMPLDNHPFLLFAHILALFLLHSDKTGTTVH